MQGGGEWSGIADALLPRILKVADHLGSLRSLCLMQGVGECVVRSEALMLCILKITDSLGPLRSFCPMRGSREWSDTVDVLLAADP